MTFQLALNEAHDLFRPFFYIQYSPGGKIVAVQPNYMEKM
jgi:hypothetical protein